MINLSLANIFSPAQETCSPSRFAGRRDKLTDLIYALESKGVHVVIYGDRGVGKSSIARQIENISRGNNSLLKRENLKIRKNFDFHTFYFTCDDSISSLEQLFQRLLSDPSCLESYIPFSDAKKSYRTTEKPKFDVKIVSLEGARERSIDKTRPIPNGDITGLFVSAIKNAAESCGNEDGLLVILDEFDRISSPLGFASIVKALSTVKVKFVITGISDSVHELVGDHESIGRQLAGGIVHVPPMSPNELNQIFDIAEKQLSDEFCFDNSARLFAINLSRGHPFFIHLIGKYSLILADKIGTKVVDEGLMRRAWADIAESKAAPIQEHYYRKVAGISQTRELIVKMLASLETDFFFTSNVYPILCDELNISSSVVSKHIRSLCKEAGVIQEVGRRQYRFMDSMFRAYAAARPALFHDE